MGTLYVRRTTRDVIDSVAMNLRLALVLPLALAACNSVGRYKCLSRQSEAKSTLGSIKVAETAHFAEHKKYTASTADLGVEIHPNFYGIELSITGSGTGFKAVAKGDKPETTGDEWSVDESGTVTAVHDKCHE